MASLRFFLAQLLLLAFFLSLADGAFSPASQEVEISSTQKLNEWLHSSKRTAASILFLFDAGDRHQQTQSLDAVLKEVSVPLKKSKMGYAKVDVSSNRDGFGKMTGIDNFPAIVFAYGTRGGIQFERYSASNVGASADAIFRACTMANAVSVSVMDGYEDLHKFNLESYNNNDVTIAGFFENPSGELYDLFHKASRMTAGEFRFAEPTNAHLMRSHGHFESIVIFKNFDEHESVYDGPMDIQNLLFWLHRRSLPLFGEWVPAREKRYNFQNLPIVYLFASLDPTIDMDAMMFHHNHMHPIAKEFDGSLIFCTASAIMYPKLMLQMGLAGPPALIIQDRKTDDGLYAYPRSVNTVHFDSKSIIDWLNKFLRRELQPYVKTASLPENPPDALILEIVGSNFKSVVYDSSKDVVVFFCSDYKDQCRIAQAAYEEKAAQFKAKYMDTVLFTKIDPEENGVPVAFTIQRTPAILLARAHHKEIPQPYDPHEDLLLFIKRFVDIPLKRRSAQQEEL